MKYKPNHTCFSGCPGCAFELGAQLAKKKPTEAAKYVWMIVGSDNPCDVRRYAFSYKEGVNQLAHLRNKKGKYKDDFTGGVWTLFKLVRVKKTSSKELNV